MSTEVEAEEDPVWTSRWDVLHKSWVQLRYHRARQRFFDLADKTTKAVTVLLSATLFGQALKEHLPWVAGAISALGLLALVYTYSDRKQLHKELAEAAAKLIGDIEQVPAGALTPALVAGWRADFARLCAKAPPPLKTLTIMCEREQAISEGQPDHVPLQPWHRRQLRHLL
jgi:hypothetical protein